MNNELGLEPEVRSAEGEVGVATSLRLIRENIEKAN
jgi:hypothetical protein